MRNVFNKKPSFSYIYGDEVLNDGQRLSDFAVKFGQSEKVQRVTGLVVLTMFTLGSQVTPIQLVYNDIVPNIN